MASGEHRAVKGTIKVFVFQNLLRNPPNIFVLDAIFVNKGAVKLSFDAVR